MDGRQVRRAGHLLLVVLISGNLGCSAVWQEVPSPVSPAPKVCLDASWGLENPSKEVIERFTDERQAHIADVMSNRQKGVIGISWDQAIHGVSDPLDQTPAPSLDSSSTVLNSDKVQSATEINTLPSTEQSESGRLMLHIKGGTKYVR